MHACLLATVLAELNQWIQNALLQIKRELILDMVTASSSIPLTLFHPLIRMTYFVQVCIESIESEL